MADQPNSTIPAITAYYHNPPVWVGDSPQIVDGGVIQLDDLIRDVFRAEVHHGIMVRVRRDGLFVFDFSGWDQVGATILPACILDENRKVCREHTEAQNVAERKALLRVLLMNVHQACLNTAHCVKHQRAFPLGPVITASRAVWLGSFEENRPHRIVCFDNNDMYHKFMVASVSGLSRGKNMSRMIIELDTVACSFDMFDSVLKSNYNNIIIVIELLYRAGVQYAESRSSEALILSWAVIEHLIGHIWSEYIDTDRRVRDGLPALSSSRRKKLTGRDYSASIMIEVLESSGLIDQEMYKNVDDARRARNSWLHSLDDVPDRIAVSSIQTACKLLQQVTGIYISLTLGRCGGSIVIREEV